MKSSLILCLMLLLGCEILAQDRKVFVKDHLYFVPDKQFKWLASNTCQTDPINADIHKKVDEQAVLLEFSQQKFDDLIFNLVADCELTETVTGILKIRLLVKDVGMICPLKVGHRNLQLTGAQLKILFDGFRQMGRTSPGRKKEEVVNSFVNLYLEINNGKLTRIIRKNFKLNDE